MKLPHASARAFHPALYGPLMALAAGLILVGCAWVVSKIDR